MRRDRRVRHFRRGVLPASYIGLVSCSLALLMFGGVAYAASLPSLIEASHDSQRHSMAYTVGSGLFGMDAHVGGAAGTAAEDEADPAGKGGSTHEGAGATAQDEKVTFGNMVVQGINVMKPQADAEGKPHGATGDAAGNPQAEGKPAAGSKPSGGSAASKPSGPDASAPSGSAPAESRPPAVSKEEEKRVRADLLACAEKLSGYVGELNAATQAFNNDLYADEATRAKRYREIDALMWRLYGEYDTVVNKISVPNESQYKSKQGNLIRMYRLLTEYASILRESWGRNQGAIDTAAELDYIMGPIRQNESGGVNRQMKEFNQVYGGFSL